MTKYIKLNESYVILILFIIFYIMPIITFFALYLRLDLSWIIHIFSDKSVQSAVLFTFWQAILSGILSVLVGFPLAYIIAHYNFRGKNVLIALYTVPFILPAIVVAYSFIFLYGRYGLITSLLGMMGMNIILGEGITGILMAHVFYNSPLSALIIGSVWSRIDQEFFDVMKAYSKSKILNFFRVMIPMLLPGILSAFLLSFLFCFLSFEIVLILGGGFYRTIEVEIYTLYVAFFDLEAAALLSLFQILVISIVIIFYANIANKVAESLKYVKTGRPLLKSMRGLKERVLIGIYLIFYTFFEVAPILLTIISGFYDPVTKSFSLRGFQILFSTQYNVVLGAPPILTPINSAFYAMISTVIVLLISIFVSKRIRYESIKGAFIYVGLLFLPMMTSRITLALSYITLFGRLGLLRDARPIVIVLHILISLPFVLKILITSYEKIDREIWDSSIVYGSPKIRFRKIELPIIKPGLVTASILALAISVGEFAASNLIVHGNYATLTIFLFMMIGARNFIAAGAAATILVLLALFLFYISLRMGESITNAF